jgi:hypothetical protein
MVGNRAAGLREAQPRHRARVVAKHPLQLCRRGSEAEPSIRLTPQQSKEADRRHRIIRPLLDWDQGIRPLLFTDDGTPIQTKDQLAAFIGVKARREPRHGLELVRSL